MIAIARREFLALWRTPTGWALAAASQLVLAWWFLSLVDRYRREYEPALTRVDSALGAGELIIAPWFGGLPTLTLVLMITAALGVRLVTDDRRWGGLSLALAGPGRAGAIAAGKYLGGLGYLTVLLCLWLTLPLSLAIGTTLDLPALASAALGMWLATAALLALSLAMAALAETPAAAAGLAFGSGLLLMLIKGGEAPGALAWWGLGGHLQGFLDARVHAADIAYFVTLVTTGLLATTARLMQLREAP
ncbi:ABC transporter permease subunit [Arhodomonas sp. AD133]|uniref:ABC transporter permease subunit n=1 Tax=Arhodomonas sp. AD133 TaxID=3415009 RepID=UPI003EC09080